MALISDPISGVADAAARIIGLFKANPNIKQEALAKLEEEALQGQIQQVLAQLDINKQEAANPNWFVAGWRPWVGWICGTGLAVQFLINPLATWIASLAGHPVAFPSLDMGTLFTLLAGMLGLGGLRSYEKLNGVSNNH